MSARLIFASVVDIIVVVISSVVVVVVIAFVVVCSVVVVVGASVEVEVVVITELVVVKGLLGSNMAFCRKFDVKSSEDMAFLDNMDEKIRVAILPRIDY